MAAVTRRQYKGAAAQTTITGSLGSGDTSVTIAATTGWPSTAAVPFYVVISPGTAQEEKCTATISGSTLTLTRAQDDTTAQSHASGATIYPVFTADDADEANKFASTMTTRGDLVTMDSGPDFARLAVGAKGAVLVTDGTDPSWRAVGIDGYRLTAASGETTGLKYDMPSVPVFADTAARDAAFGGTGEKTLADGQVCYIIAAPKRLQVYNGTAWIDFDAAYTDISSTQAFTGFTKGNATVVSKYARLGKFVHFYGSVGLGSTSSMAGPLDVTLPVTAAQGIYYHPSACYFIDASASVLYWGTALNISTTGVRLVTHKVDGTYAINFDVSATAPFTWTTSDGFYWNHFYEAA